MDLLVMIFISHSPFFTSLRVFTINVHHSHPQTVGEVGKNDHSPKLIILPMFTPDFSMVVLHDASWGRPSWPPGCGSSFTRGQAQCLVGPSFSSKHLTRGEPQSTAVVVIVAMAVLMVGWHC